MNVFKNKKRWKNKKTLKNVKKRALNKKRKNIFTSMLLPAAVPSMSDSDAVRNVPSDGGVGL